MKDSFIKIKVAQTNEEKEMIYKQRYSIYIEEMKKNIDSCDHINKMIYDELDDFGILLYAVNSDNQIVGSTRLNIGKSNDFPKEYREMFIMDLFQEFSNDSSILSMSSMLMIVPEYRNSKILYDFFEKAYHLAMQKGVVFNFAICTYSLLYIYETLGYRRFKDNFTLPNLGIRIPLVFLPQDLIHIKKIKSPTYRIMKNVSYRNESRSWFLKSFPKAEEIDILCNSSKTDLFNLIQNSTFAPNLIPYIFKGLPIQQVLNIINKSTVISYKKDEFIIRETDVVDVIWILLSGNVDITEYYNYSISKRIIYKGDIIAETKLINNDYYINAKALTDCELMLIPITYFENIRKKNEKAFTQIVESIQYNIYGIRQQII